MNRRTFSKLASLAAIGTLAKEADARAESMLPVEGKEVNLENDHFLIAFNRGSGAITRFVRKTTNWTIERRPELGVSFRLLAPLAKQRDNFILGQKQRAASVEKVSDTRVRLRWTDLVSEHGGVLAITLTAAVTLEGTTLSFEAALDNDSPLTVETIDYPYFGDLKSARRGRDPDIRAHVVWESRAA
ncbi:MAG TPA: hypothetical protein VKT75_18815 [Acidobacteriaceae bacterium]|nr:hypothetical protein [Acidobacteriaceae bacterium]